MSKKCIILDLDGTVVDSPTQKLPTQRFINIVDKLQDQYIFTVATGRSWGFGKDILQSLPITTPCIISAGTQICHPQTGEIIRQKDIEPSALHSVLAIVQKEYPEGKILFNDYNENDYFHGNVLPDSFIVTEGIHFFEQTFVPDAIAIRIHDLCVGIEGITCVMVLAQKPGCRDLHFINEFATKEHTIAELLKHLHIDKKDTIGVGDGHNDIHLFNAVGYKIAMGNAVEDLKQRADIIIGNVQDDGLATYLESLLDTTKA